MGSADREYVALPNDRFGLPPRVRLTVPTSQAPRREQVKSAKEITEILDAYDLTGSFRDAGELADCSHHTVAR